ncbi:MAG TPA: heparan-alpha-glucosaminide N-acetyltransferase domain-containing protein [Puia sp.]|nr:heparan-alpha-glucosaminide N-acetyltransferase domain-containing protein [Puia sp.]
MLYFQTKIIAQTIPLRSPAAIDGRLTRNNIRITSIDLLRGTVMIIMALDHVRDYFHRNAFFFNPTDLTQTSVPLFFTRWITHFCAPVFVFLSGISAHLSGRKKGKKALAVFLLKRGIWLVLAELFIVTLEWTFNPAYPAFSFQVIWAIGVSMIAMSALVRLNPRVLAVLAIVLIAGHNLLDPIHVPGTGPASIAWSLLHEPGDYAVGPFKLLIRYSVLPWIGIMAAGYCLGPVFVRGYPVRTRKRILLLGGGTAIFVFILLRAINLFGDPAPWSIQNNIAFDILSFLNVTKYPPSLLYTLMTLGPALIFLGLAERPLNRMTAKISIFGRVPMFYYFTHLLVIHLLALVGVMIAGHPVSDMILHDRVNRVPALKGYGFDLLWVYAIWIAVVLILFPVCRWYDLYKKSHRTTQWWLSYV